MSESMRFPGVRRCLPLNRQSSLLAALVLGTIVLTWAPRADPLHGQEIPLFPKDSGNEIFFDLFSEQIAVSPNGRWFVFWARHDAVGGTNNYALFSVRPEGGPPNVIDPENTGLAGDGIVLPAPRNNESPFVFTADGSQVLFEYLTASAQAAAP